MISTPQLAQEIRNSLGHLYDPTFAPSSMVYQALGVSPSENVKAVQVRLRQVIEEMRPAADVPEASRAHRLYNVLRLRYVEKLSQENTAERLGLTTRHLRREQGRAIDHLVQKLTSEVTDAPPALAPATDPSPLSPNETTDAGGWEEQVRSEVAALRKAAPQRSVDVLSVVQSAASTARVLATRTGVGLCISENAQPAMVQARKSALKQIVLSMITNVTRRMSGGEISITTVVEGEQVQIVITASPVQDPSETRGFLLSQLLAEEGMYVRADATDIGLRMSIALPMVRKLKVMVVDDNQDLLHFYRRFTTGTSFDIVPFDRADLVLPTIAENPPDIVLLDIMLPGIDGWELLAGIRDLEQGHALPIVICSVMREQALALALGADLFVAKPVRRQEFLGALDKAASLAQARDAKSDQSNVATC